MSFLELTVLLACVQSAPALDGLKAEGVPEGPREVVGILGKAEEYSGDGRHQIHGLAFSPKGDLLGVAAGSSLRLFDLSGPLPKEAGTIEAFVGRGYAWAFSPDGASVAVCTRKSVGFWTLSRRPPTKEAEFPPGTTGSTISFSPDGTLLAIGSRDRVELWDVKGGPSKPGAVLQGHAKPVDLVTFSPSGRQLASGSFAETVRLWNSPGGESKNVLKSHGGHLWCLRFAPDEERLVVISNAKAEQGRLRLWNLKGEPKETVLKEHADWIRSVMFTPDGTHLISVGGDGEIVRWNVSESRALDRRKLPGESLDYHAAALSPDGRYLAILHKDTRVFILRLAG